MIFHDLPPYNTDLKYLLLTHLQVLEKIQALLNEQSNISNSEIRK